MTMLKTLLLTAVLCATSSNSSAGLFTRASTCRDSCAADGCQTPCGPGDYCCQPEYSTEKVKKQCFETKRTRVVVPPVTIPCCRCALKKLFRRGGECSVCSCSDGCSDGCGKWGQSCNGGVLNRLCSKLTACRVCCVNTYSKKECECGTRCVVKWKAVCKGSCSAAECCQTGAIRDPECAAPSGCTP